MAYETALITNTGKLLTSNMWAYGTAFRIVGYVLNDGGNDQRNPRVALPAWPNTVSPVRTAEERQGSNPPIWPASGYEPYTSLDTADPACFSYRCEVPLQLAIPDVSSICLIAEIVSIGDNDPNPPSIGTRYVFAVMNFPLTSKTAGKELVFTLTPRS